MFFFTKELTLLVMIGKLRNNNSLDKRESFCDGLKCFDFETPLSIDL
jgi:hypothetical protein